MASVSCPRGPQLHPDADWSTVQASVLVTSLRCAVPPHDAWRDSEQGARASRSQPVLWLFVAVAVLAVATAGALVGRQLYAGRYPDFAAPGSSPRPSASPDVAVRVSGSGSNIALFRKIIAACRSNGHVLNVRVAEGIGSTAGLRALHDGMLDAALVSRPLKVLEQSRDDVVTVYAHSPVAFAAHPGLNMGTWSTSHLLAALATAAPLGPDGVPLRWLLREPGDSGHQLAAAALPDFAATEAATRNRATAQVYYHDRTLHGALLSTPGAIGLVDVSAVRAEGLPLQLLSWNGHLPDANTVTSGVWPLVKPLALVRPRSAATRLQPLETCLRSPLAATVIADAGAQPALAKPVAEQ